MTKLSPEPDEQGHNIHSLPMHKSLDIEPQCGADTHDVLTIELLEDGCLAGVVQTTAHILSHLK